MKFTFDLNALVSVLPIMFYGVLGGLLVMLALYGVLQLLFMLGKRKHGA